MVEAKLVLSTTGSREEAQKIARALVEEQLAACVNVLGPLQSIYRWQGHIDSADEFLLIIKTMAVMLPRLQTRIRELHSYQLPEIVEVNIEGGSEAYLRWIEESIKR
jgi:periplasmic divalent cation tolerance protein